MFSRHLIKMLIGLAGMALFGLICLFVVTLYQKENTTASAGTPSDQGSVSQ